MKLKAGKAVTGLLALTGSFIMFFDTPKTKLSSLRQVDWENREYIPGVLKLKDGSSEIHEYAELGAVHDTHIFKLVKISFGDLTGDKQEEAVVAVNEDAYTASNSWTSGWLFVYVLKDSKIVQLASAVESSEILDVSIKDGMILMKLPCGKGSTVKHLIYKEKKLQPHKVDTDSEECNKGK